MEYLPVELEEHILGFIRQKDIVACRFVCKTWKEMLSSPNARGYVTWCFQNKYYELITWAYKNGCPCNYLDFVKLRAG